MSPTSWNERDAQAPTFVEGHRGSAGTSDTFILFLLESSGTGFVTPQPIANERTAPAFSSTERTAVAPAFTERVQP